jgi:uncharacterized protein (DUF1778 family)
MSAQIKDPKLDVWMEVTLVLDPAEYRLIRDHARLESKNVSEFVTKLIHQFIDEDIGK